MKQETIKAEAEKAASKPKKSDLEKELEETRRVLEEMTKQKLALDQSVSQLRDKEEISNKTISELQQQIRSLIEDQ